MSTLLTDGSMERRVFFISVIVGLKRVCHDKISNLFSLIASLNRYNEKSCFSEENRDQDQALNNCTENGKAR